MDAQFAIRDNKRSQAHADRCRVRIEECPRIIPHGAERLDRRNEVIFEALVEEVQRGEQRKERSDNTTAAIPEPEPAASAAQDLRESPIEPDLNPKRILHMKSASSTASGSGQQRDKRPVIVAEPRMQTGDPLEMVTGENTRRGMVMKSEAVAVTTREAGDRYREKAMRIASFEQIELENLSITGQCSSGLDNRASLDDCR